MQQKPLSFIDVQAFLSVYIFTALSNSQKFLSDWTRCQNKQTG